MRYICTAAKQTAPGPGAPQKETSHVETEKAAAKAGSARTVAVGTGAGPHCRQAGPVQLPAHRRLAGSFPHRRHADVQRLAKSISAGNWLGEYDWLTLGKHSFYALWLAFLNLLHVNIVVGGQALFAVSCLVLLAALKPVMRTNWGRLFVFAVTLYTPASWAENTLRVYRDNIYPSLVLLALAGLLGAFTRFREKPLRAALLCCRRPFPLRQPGAMPQGQRAAAAVRSVRGGGLSCLSVSGQKHCAQKEPSGAAAGTISAVGRRHRGLVRHELQVLWPFYHQRFHFQRIQ